VLALALALALGLGQVPGRVLEPGLAQAQEREREQALGLEPALGVELVPHKQPSSRLTTMPAGLIIFSFSSIKILHLNFGWLKLLFY